MAKCLSITIYMYITVLKKISADFVLGYIQAMDGEKDPRNLQLVFNSVPFIVKHLDLGN